MGRALTAVAAIAQRLRPGAPSWPVMPGLAALLVLVSMVSALVAVGTTGSSAAETGSGPAGPTGRAEECGQGWVTAWQTGAQPVRVESLGGRTLRMVVRPQTTGTQVRVRLSNRYGAQPLVVGQVSAGWSDGGSGLVPGTARPAGFAGSDSVVVAPGADVLSDPVAVVAEAGRPLAVSMFLPGRPDVLTAHGIALQTSYVSGAGDFALAPDGAAFGTEVRSWYVLTGLDVLAPRAVNALVATGDSITDGVGGAVDADERWSDALAGRLGRVGGAAVMSVLNAGISRNQLLSDRPEVNGDSPLTRFDRDVAAAAGVTDVVLHVGTNDIAAGRGADEIIDGFVRYTEVARRAGRSVFLTTITPSDRGDHGTARAVAVRVTVNDWVRVHGRQHADGVFDFAAAVADPVHPSRLAPAFDSGDGLHLSAAGYRALAGAVDVDRLSGSPCLADRSPARVVLSGN